MEARPRGNAAAQVKDPSFERAGHLDEEAWAMFDKTSNAHAQYLMTIAEAEEAAQDLEAEAWAQFSRTSSNVSYASVELHLYRIVPLLPLYHAEVHLHGRAWTFGRQEGVACASDADRAGFHRPDLRLRLGWSKVCAPEVDFVARLMVVMGGFEASGYKLCGRNCVDFCDAFVARLGIPPTARGLEYLRWTRRAARWMGTLRRSREC